MGMPNSFRGSIQCKTRMVQLPATAAIEYVAAPGRTFVRGGGGLCPFPQFQCVYEPSRLSVPSIVA